MNEASGHALARVILLVVLALCAACAASPAHAPRPGADLAASVLRGGAPQIALRIADDVLAGDPGNTRALLVQGDALTALGRLDGAALSYRAVLRGDPDSVGAQIGLGRTLLATDPATAEGWFLRASRLAPRDAAALNDLGVARDLQRRHADAQIAYRMALAADPQMTGAQVNLALSLAMSGQTAQAVGLLRPLASAAAASSKLRHDLAAVLVLAGERAEAERILSADLTPEQVARAMAAYAASGDAIQPQPTAASVPPPATDDGDPPDSPALTN